MQDDPADATTNSDWLLFLVNQFARLCDELKEAARTRDEILTERTNTNDEYAEEWNNIVEDSATRSAAISQLCAVLNFLEGGEHLAPELHKLLMALMDLQNGRTIEWLSPEPKRGQPPPLVKESFLHGRYAAVMDWLMKEGGKNKEEAARFVVEHGGIRRRIEANGRARRAAHAWKTVANWRDRATGPYDPSCAAKHCAFTTVYEFIKISKWRERKGPSASVEDEAKNMLCLLNNLF
jgi:hypothetical protein